MCGITGVISFENKKIIRQSQLVRMTNELSHRGPDDSGIFLSEDKLVGLGFRRLSIIDLSPNGHQPMKDNKGKAWIVFNGEIYNFIEIRNQLLLKGYSFNSNSDSEVLLNAYLEWGESCLDHLNGMFAFAIWDEVQKKLFLARDRFGIKPLYYTVQHDFFAFASELKSLVRIPELLLPLNIHAIWNYLTLLQIPAPETIYSSVQKLLPGHAIKITNGKTEVWKYWSPDVKPDYLTSEKDLTNEVLHKLKLAVKSHLISDVPVGVFLSGGIDSSAIVALASEALSEPVKTFSVRFSSDPIIDEGDFQKLIVEKFKTDHTEFHIQPDILDAADLILHETDEPFAVSSAIPLYYISKMAAKHVKVVLSGDGGDELFGGYVPRYEKAMISDKLNNIPGFMKKPVRKMADSIYRLQSRNQKLRRIHRLFSLSEYGKNERYLYSFGYFSHFEKLRLFKPEKIEGIRKDFGEYYQSIFDSAPEDSMQRFFYIDLMTALGDEMLTKSDRCTSMVSLEGRVPFLDNDLAELALKIPGKLKSNKGDGKIILKNALRGILPDIILDGKKRGFNIPMDRLIYEQINEIQSALLFHPEPEFQQMFEKSEIENIINLHMHHDTNYGHHIWTLLQLNNWFKIENERKANALNETLFI